MVNLYKLIIRRSALSDMACPSDLFMDIGLIGRWLWTCSDVVR